MAKHHKDDPHRPRNQTSTFTKQEMPKAACISVDTVTKRCVTGLACANIFKRKGVLFSLQPLCVKQVLHNPPWEPLWPHLKHR